VIRAQEQTNYSNPREHFVWALRNLPMIAGIGGITHPMFLTQWSEHLFNCGFFHTDYIAGFADENGMIHVSQLPGQIIAFQAAARGPRNAWNNAARWDTEGSPEPAPVTIPDINELSANERAAILGQFIDAGLVEPPDSGPAYLPAEVVE